MRVTTPAGESSSSLSDVEEEEGVEYGGGRSGEEEEAYDSPTYYPAMFAERNTTPRNPWRRRMTDSWATRADHRGSHDNSMTGSTTGGQGKQSELWVVFIVIVAVLLI